jgi:hypothetical protein
MSDKDKKVVNTEEQNRAVNPGDSVTQEDSISQEPSHRVDTEHSASSRPGEETAQRNAVNDTDDNESRKPDLVEGDDIDLERQFMEE